VTDMRWREEMAEAMELIYRLQTDYNGSLPENEAREIGPWVLISALLILRVSAQIASNSAQGSQNLPPHSNPTGP
jgi:hypothetical protein